jgi:hypothetical protein
VRLAECKCEAQTQTGHLCQSNRQGSRNIAGGFGSSDLVKEARVCLGVRPRDRARVNHMSMTGMKRFNQYRRDRRLSMCHMNMVVTIVTSGFVVLWLATASTKLRYGLTGEIPMSATTKHGT